MTDLDAANAAPAARLLGAARGWTAREFTCRAGPGDAPFEERQEGFSLALVLEGVFTSHCASGRALMHPGSVMLGNHGACYACGHEHGVGDRCRSLAIAPDLFAEIAAATGAGADFRFPAGKLTPDRALMAQSALLGATGLEPLLAEERILAFAAGAIRSLAGSAVRLQAVSAADMRRIARVLRHIEHAANEPQSLDRLAAIAALSKFHFLRVFRRVTGKTPNQFVTGARLTRCAEALVSTHEPVSRIAFDTGFGDLSSFNAAFRVQFGDSPLAFRRKYR